jgi:high affinity Mn2+ porin
MRTFGPLAAVATLLLCAPSVRAEVSEAAGRPDEQFDFMNLLTQHGLHDIKYERWNAYGQFTWISSFKPGFAAAYTNAGGSTNSLLPTPEHSFTGTLTFYLGARLWPGAEAYLVPEVITERPLSQLRGLGGAVQNFELQKTGSEAPQVYRSRTYIRQTINLGGEKVEHTSDPQQLAGWVDSHRLMFAIGNFAIGDFFDKNVFSGDLRRQFFNMVFLTYAAWDFASDARGYSYGGVAEIDWDAWSVRYARITPPKNPNQLAVDFRIDKYYGDQVELEHSHVLFGQPGAVRVLGYRNQVNSGRFDDAVAAFRSDPSKNAAACDGAGLFNYGSRNVFAPDLCWVRGTTQKLGIGVNVEQHITKDIGVFFRGMYSDGQSEVYAFTSSDRSISWGALAKGAPWRRPFDLAGIGAGINWISQAHANYLRMGGIDGFIGDGKLALAPESVFEIFYSFNLVSATWLSLDWQHIWNPAFNADRGPVDVLGARFHAEF